MWAINMWKVKLCRLLETGQQKETTDNALFPNLVSELKQHNIPVIAFVFYCATPRVDVLGSIQSHASSSLSMDPFCTHFSISLKHQANKPYAHTETAAWNILGNMIS